MHRALILITLNASVVVAYDNGAPNARLPTLGWSSWIALGPGAGHPVFDYCDAAGIMAAADAFVEVGLYDAGYRHFHLDDCANIPSRDISATLGASAPLQRLGDPTARCTTLQIENGHFSPQVGRARATPAAT